VVIATTSVGAAMEGMIVSLMQPGAKWLGCLPMRVGHGVLQ
jgi:hypothetical protein